MAIDAASEPLALTLAGSLVEAGVTCAYLLCAARRSPRGRPWPVARTASFVAGMTLLALALQSPLAARDDLASVHAAQHLVVMMVVPPLLVLGAPITLLLRTVSPAARREIVAVLHDPAMKAMNGPVAGFGLVVEYYATMFVVMLTPLYGWSVDHAAVHVAVHGYLLLCGLLFWMPLVGRDPAGWRPSPRAKRVAVAAGVPIYAALGLMVGLRGEPLGGRDTLATTHAAGWVLGAGGIALTLAGLALVRAQRTATRSAPRERWKARRMLATSKAMATQQAMEPEP